jgi:subtilisin family serine protease
MNGASDTLRTRRHWRTVAIARVGGAAIVLGVLGFVIPGRGGSITAAVQGAGGAGPASASAGFRKGELLVKFRPGVHPPAAQLYQRRQSFAPYTGSSYLDAVHQRYRVTDIRPLFPLARSAGRRNAPPDATAAEWSAQLQDLRQRYARRAQRAAVHAVVPDLTTIYKINVPPDTDIQQLAAEYAADPSVEYAEPNYEYHLFFAPNDPFFDSSGSWGQKFPDLWGLKNIQAEQGWDLSTGAGVTVAVIDTGLADHPDIHDNIWTNPGEIPDNGIDDDGNGYIDDVHGWLFPPEVGPSKGPSELFDAIGHGTHVAGIIAATGNNDQGIIGVAWHAKVMPLGIFEPTFGTTTSDAIAEALAYAVQNGADTVNMSLGGPGESFLVRDAIDYAAAQGLVLVAAAGNDSIDATTQYPARYDAVVAVAAVDHLDQLSSFSNWGGKIELAAPGGGDTGRRGVFLPMDSVLSLAAHNSCGGGNACLTDFRLTLPAPVGDGTTAFVLRLAGTSMAAPHVSGTAALILSRHPEFTVEQVRQALRDGADDFGPPGRDARYGYGRLNAAASVALDAVAVARLTAPKHLSRCHGELITVEGTIQNPGGPAPSWQLLFGPQGQALSQIATGTGAVDHGELASIDTGPLDRGNYLLRLEVTAADGAWATDTVTFTRLASRPYLRQVSDAGSSPFGLALSPTAWSDDARTLVWTEQTTATLTFQRVVVMDLAAGGEREIAAFRFGHEIPASFFPTVHSAISGDATTVAFAAPEDLSTSTAETRNRNFQLFVSDMPTGILRQVSHASGARSRTSRA